MSDRPEWCQGDVWETSLDVSEPINPSTILHDIIAGNAARAILAERERCAAYIERYAGMVPERQEMASDIRAGVSLDAWGQRRT